MNNITFNKNDLYKLDSLESIQEYFKDLQIFAKVESVSQSWMSRKINFYIAFDNDIKNINFIISKVTWYKQDAKTWAIKVSWCWMDMIFAVLSHFYSKLYNNYSYINYLSI